MLFSNFICFVFVVAFCFDSHRTSFLFFWIGVCIVFFRQVIGLLFVTVLQVWTSEQEKKLLMQQKEAIGKCFCRKASNAERRCGCHSREQRRFQKDHGWCQTTCQKNNWQEWQEQQEEWEKGAVWSRDERKMWQKKSTSISGDDTANYFHQHFLLCFCSGTKNCRKEQERKALVKQKLLHKMTRESKEAKELVESMKRSIWNSLRWQCYFAKSLMLRRSTVPHIFLLPNKNKQYSIGSQLMFTRCTWQTKRRIGGCPRASKSWRQSKVDMQKLLFVTPKLTGCFDQRNLFKPKCLVLSPINHLQKKKQSWEILFPQKNTTHDTTHDTRHDTQHTGEGEAYLPISWFEVFWECCWDTDSSVSFNTWNEAICCSCSAFMAASWAS